jgi:methylmalonyl-CoA mutase N-terminal domain/subunit
MDETLALPTEKAVKIALRTQQIIAEETEVAHVIDPLAGSYLVEAETNRLEEEAEKYFAEIERRGGVVAATEAGWIQREIHRSAVAYQRAVERGTKKVVGVNCYAEEDGAPTIEVLKIDAAVEKDQRERLAALRKRRDARQAKAALDAVRGACRGKENLLERFVAAAHAYCTLGEIAGVLREEFGEYKEPKTL